MTQTNLEATIVETITIDAPRAAVFAALTEPDQLTAWWGSDDSYRCATMERDLRAGGAWNTTGRGSDGKPFSVAGVYRIVEPPARLEFTWRYDWHDGATDAPETIVRYDLAEHGALATALTVTHSGFTSPGDRDDHVRGWKTVLGWLRGYLTR
jgi:uncharacterized protein YndB with AHSA1/START domain